MHKSNYVVFGATLLKCNTHTISVGLFTSLHHNTRGLSIAMT